MNKIFPIIIISILSILICTESSATTDNYYFPPLTGNEWETISPAELNWNSEKIDKLYTYLDEKNSKGFLVLHKGKIVMEKYFGDFGQDSLWYWASAAKTITAFLVGIAQEQEYLSIDNPASDYLGKNWTGCTEEQEAAITVKHLLTMTSGLDDEVEDNHCTLPECLIYKAEPGTRWAYHNAPRSKLQDLLIEAVGTSDNLYMKKQLSNKIGMTGFWYLPDNDHLYFSNLRSMARFGLMILNQGKWDESVIMTDSEYFCDMINTSQDLNKSYGYMWWLNGKGSYMLPGFQYIISADMIPAAPDDLIAALGKNDQKIYISPSNDLVVVRMGEDAGNPFAGAESFNNELWTMLSEIIDLNSGVKQQDSDMIKIYPNPVTDKMTIAEIARPCNIEIYNSSGLRILSENSSALMTVDMDDFAAGLYLIRVSDSAGKILKEMTFVKI